MNGTPSPRVTSARRIARSNAWRSLSMTHGPAIRTNGLPPPIAKPSSLMGITATIISADVGPGGGLDGQDGREPQDRRDVDDRIFRLALPARPAYPAKLCYRRRGSRRRMCGFPLVARLDEACKKRMRVKRLRFE